MTNQSNDDDYAINGPDDERCYGCLCGVVHACVAPCYYWCPPCAEELNRGAEETKRDWLFERILAVSGLPFDWCGGPT